MPERVVGVLVTHGRLGEELLRTAESILGPQEGIELISNSETTPESLAGRVEAAISWAAGARTLVFVDLLGGSCGQVCQELRRRHPGVAVVSGVNLPMLLEFLYHRARVGPEELKERILNKGRDGIRWLE